MSAIETWPGTPGPCSRTPCRLDELQVSDVEPTRQGGCDELLPATPCDTDCHASAWDLRPVAICNMQYASPGARHSSPITHALRRGSGLQARTGTAHSQVEAESRTRVCEVAAPSPKPQATMFLQSSKLALELPPDPP